ncbi:MAG: hypothetical protein KIT84_07895 [Labilithrix sp.]|nr:hypothetical protein [Labilithrix sp.]MCW5810919.1 hypothetical protein [Labilithrix sp.]
MVIGLAMAGCAAEPSEEEEVGGSEEALSKGDAYAKVVAAGRFRSGHLACGRTLTLTGSTGPTGRYELEVQPCEGEDGDGFRSKGSFEVVGGWFGGLLTNPTMKMTPSATGAEPWSFKISMNDEVIWLTDEAGTLVPEGMLD